VGLIHNETGRERSGDGGVRRGASYSGGDIVIEVKVDVPNASVMLVEQRAIGYRSPSIARKSRTGGESLLHTLAEQGNDRCARTGDHQRPATGSVVPRRSGTVA
jgi:hypothetical protein